ncbi:MAG TPA: ClpXP protease specificity-enhancing factor [Steroidobacteraceae bacterium]|nr:ClpXP protease specificity-enhancing factor [Steroidobacteraceae bacterium]
MSELLPKRPYLLRAMHEWISDCGNTPHVIVDAGREGTEVPRAYVRDGKIVLNLSEGATQHLTLGSEWVEFDARFAGITHHVRFPVSAVLGIYARETNEGMVFSEQDLGSARREDAATADSGEPPDTPPPTKEERGPRRPQLKIIK